MSGSSVRRALVVSPTPSHPADHGHRNRVRQTTSLLVAAGYVIDFLLYPMDDDWRAAIPAGLAQMNRAWGGARGGIVAVVPPGRPLHTLPEGSHHTIDAWWDARLEEHIAFLCNRRTYEVMLVNYVFLSRAFLHCSRRCRRILDTHDRMTGRRELFERNDAPAEFFFTTEAEEARGLSRADIVLAIKQSEAVRFRELTDRRVITLPFAPRRPRPAPRRPPGDSVASLRIGFIGSDNSVNALNLAAFLRRLAVWRRLYLPDLVMIVAGNVCARLAPAPDFVTLLGRVADVAAFYASVDLVVAPLAFSTGLKIKVAEALAHGLAVVATADAFDGFPATDPYHHLPDIDAVCGAVIALAADRGRLAVLTRATARAAAASRRQVAQGVAALRAALAAPRRILQALTDSDFAARATLAEERCWQAVDYFSHLLDVRVQGPDAITALERVGTWLDLRGGVPRLMIGDRPVRASLPPLRYLPPGMDWGRPIGGLPFALLVVAQSDCAEESAARAALKRALCAVCRPFRLAVVRTAGLPDDPAALATLGSLPGPQAVIAVDLDDAARDLLACMAALAGAAFFPLGGPYPLVAAGAPGTLVRNLREHIRAVAAWLRAPGPSCESEATADAGWSVLWARLADQPPVHVE